MHVAQATPDVPDHLLCLCRSAAHSMEVQSLWTRPRSLCRWITASNSRCSRRYSCRILNLSHMKRYFLIFGLSMVFISCKKYLDQTPDPASAAPKTIQGLQQLLDNN